MLRSTVLRTKPTVTLSKVPKPHNLSTMSTHSTESHIIPSHAEIPNCKGHNLPLVIFRQALQKSDVSADAFENLLSKNGWAPQWRFGMYSYSHFHSVTPEALGVFQGSATLLFGGDHNPQGLKTDVQAGDVILIPPGVAHRNLEMRDHFQMVGSYPNGKQWDMCRGGEDGAEMRCEETAAEVDEWKNPVTGDTNGPWWK